MDQTALTTEQLDALLAKYRAFEEIEVAPEANLPDDASKLAEVTRLEAAHGTFYTLTQEDLDANPVLVQEGFTVGEELLGTEAELETIAEATKAAADAKAATATAGATGDTATASKNEGDNAASSVATAPVNTGASQQQAPENAPVEEDTNQDDVDASTAAEKPAGETVVDFLDHLFKGKHPVLAVRDRLINGKTYKEVDVPGETHTLSDAEFKEQVRPRGEA